MIEHIGSTSVPGLMAKPIIDILLVVEDAGKEEDYMDDLCRHGYILRVREPDFENHHMFKGPDTDIHLHVFQKGQKKLKSISCLEIIYAYTMMRENFMRIQKKS